MPHLQLLSCCTSRLFFSSFLDILCKTRKDLAACPSFAPLHLLNVEKHVEKLTLVQVCSSQVGSHRDNHPQCWSSRNCRGSWQRSTHSHRGRHGRTGHRRTQMGRHTCNSPGCCGKKQSHMCEDWSTRFHL